MSTKDLVSSNGLSSANGLASENGLSSANRVASANGLATDVKDMPIDYTQVFEAYYKCKGREELLEAYNETPAQYHEGLKYVKYGGHTILGDMAVAVTSQYQDRSQLKVIDICAGSGMVGEALSERHFKHITAHDGAQGMVDYCRNTGDYNAFICCLLEGVGSIPVKNDTYDLVTVAGAFVENHIPVSGLEELVRIVKPGGHVLNAIRVNVLDTDYGQEYENIIKSLETKNVLKRYARVHFPKYNRDMDGVVDIFTVC